VGEPHDSARPSAARHPDRRRRGDGRRAARGARFPDALRRPGPPIGRARSGVDPGAGSERQLLPVVHASRGADADGGAHLGELGCAHPRVRQRRRRRSGAARPHGAGDHRFRSGAARGGRFVQPRHGLGPDVPVPVPALRRTQRRPGRRARRCGHRKRGSGAPGRAGQRRRPVWERRLERQRARRRRRRPVDDVRRGGPFGRGPRFAGPPPRHDLPAHGPGQRPGFRVPRLPELRSGERAHRCRPLDVAAHRLRGQPGQRSAGRHLAAGQLPRRRARRDERQRGHLLVLLRPLLDGEGARDARRQRPAGCLRGRHRGGPDPRRGRLPGGAPGLVLRLRVSARHHAGGRRHVPMFGRPPVRCAPPRPSLRAPRARALTRGHLHRSRRRRQLFR
jgi:hypothetical protein